MTPQGIQPRIGIQVKYPYLDIPGEKPSIWRVSSIDGENVVMNFVSTEFGVEVPVQGRLLIMSKEVFSKRVVSIR